MRGLRTKAISLPCRVKNVLNRSFIHINSLIPCIFALPESKIIFRAKVSMRNTFYLFKNKNPALMNKERRGNYSVWGNPVINC